MHPFHQYVNPHLAELLEQLRLDKVFVRGEGCWLWDQEGRRYLDFVAAYGALPFGFNPPAIWSAIQDAYQRGEPSFVQPSALQAAGELAERLVALAPAGIRYVTFTNSGAEAVEAAIKLARAATGRPRILSTINAFHGKTLGALSATHRETYQKAFFAPVEGFDAIPYGDLKSLSHALESRPGQYAAFIVEPIQGEGGIVEPPPGYLAEAQRLCRAHGVLFIVDEVQTGLGRTGALFACQREGVTPDALTLAKALGGGLIPIGALLCTEAVYTEEFATKHSSTFAGNTLACRAGLATLDLLTRDDQALVRHVAAMGDYLKRGLLDIQRRYPRVLRSVRGRGFMLGLQFGVDRRHFPGNLLGVMGEQELLTPVVASYLLNVEGLRVAPTLNGSDVIRIEPPLVAGREECDYALAAIERVVARIDAEDTAGLVRHLVGGTPASTAPGSLTPHRGATQALAPVPSVTRLATSANGWHPPTADHGDEGAAEEPASPSGDPEEGRFAFLVHPLDLDNYTEFDPSLATLTRRELAELAERWNHLLEPFRIGQTRIVSACERSAYGEFYVVPRTAAELLAMPPAEAVAQVEKALRLAEEAGARIVGLGAYTSVVTRGGLHLRHTGVALTTGNSYTVAAAVEAVGEATRRLGFPLAHLTAAVVGATGAIGRAVSILLAHQVQRLVLIGNPARPEQSRRRLLRVAAEICRQLLAQGAPDRSRGRSPGALGTPGPDVAMGVPSTAPLAQQLLAFGGWPSLDAPVEAFVDRCAQWMERDGCPLTITHHLDRYLPVADVIVTATSSTAHLVRPDNVKHGAVVCDLSRPPNVSREVQARRPDVLVIDGGVVQVPGRPSMGWNFGFERGLVYACMAETMMLALEHHYQHTSLGADLNLETIGWLQRLAKKHGFRVAQLRSFDRPLSEEAWQRLLRARAQGAPAEAAPLLRRP